MGRPGGSSLSRGLDREVHAAMNKYLDNNAVTPSEASVDTIYSYIKRSNSSLGRKSKALLEDCITRILDVMRADESEDDSLLEADTSHGDPRATDTTSENAMNRRLTAGWNLPVANRQADSNENFAKKRLQNSSPNGTNSSTTTEPTTAVTRKTKRVKIASNKNQSDSKPSSLIPPEPRITLGQIGGMDKQIDRLKYLLWLPFRMPERFTSQRLTIPRGVLLHGPPGCGKTMLCEAFAHLLQVPFISVSAPSIVSGMSGESEKAIRDHFDKAVQVAPSLIFIDEIDAITPKRESTQRQMEARIVAQLLTCMDDLAPEKTGGNPVMVLAATNRPNSLDSALRRAGRFDTEIEIGVPDAAAREAVLRRMTAGMTLAPDVDIARLARLTPGFVGADLASLVREAIEPAQRRFVDAWANLAQARAQSHDVNTTPQGAQDDVEMSNEVPLPDPQEPETTQATLSNTTTESRALAPGAQLEAMDALYLSSPSLSAELSATTAPTSMPDFLAAISAVQASSTREGFATIPNVPWSTVGAYHATRATLQKTIIGPIAHPELYARFSQTPPGILLYGPPGCGKTLLAKAVASASRANFISVKGPELLNKYVGESERAVRQLFSRARYSQPVIVFFDELDALVPRRDDAKSEAGNRVVNAMLAELDGVAPREEVYVVAATNRRDAIDPAILRPGRLGKSIYVGLPGAEEREEIFATIMRAKPVRENDRAGIAAVARGCEAFSGADLQNLAYEAGMIAIDRCVAGGLEGDEERFIEIGDITAALEGLRPSVSVAQAVQDELEG